MTCELSAATGIDLRTWEPDLLVTLADVVRENHERAATAWSHSDELLAVAVDRLGVIGSERHRFKTPPDRIRRPHEPKAKRGMSAVSFIRSMAGAGKKRR